MLNPLNNVVDNWIKFPNPSEKPRMLFPNKIFTTKHKIFFPQFFLIYVQLNAKYITRQVFLNDIVAPVNDENNWEILYGCAFVLMENDMKS